MLYCVSSSTWVCSAAHARSLLDGIGVKDGEEVVVAGRTKGSAPVGDAWLLDGIVTKSTPVNFR